MGMSDEELERRFSNIETVIGIVSESLFNVLIAKGICTQEEAEAALLKAERNAKQVATSETVRN